MSLLPPYVHSSWVELLDKPGFKETIDDIEKQIQNPPKQHSLPGAGNHPYFPQTGKVMRFMERDIKTIRCVMLGMEPYPSCYTDENGNVLPVATGRSFEVADVDSWQQKFKQSSLRNILKTIYYNKTGNIKSLEDIRSEIAGGKFPISQPHEWFDNLEQQGVLFLNATLTVEPGHPDSHTALWKPVMDDIIRYINKKTGAKWLLLGNKAQNRVAGVIGNSDRIYKCCHPRLPGFVEENIFQYVPDVRWEC